MAANKRVPKPSLAELRAACAALLIQAVEETLSARQAINRWPAPRGTDPSLDVAYQALLHFEADDDQQQSELFYMDAQLALLSQMAAFLAQNRPLPPYILTAYSSEHQTAVFDERAVLIQPLQRLYEAFQSASRLFRQAVLTLSTRVFRR